MEKAILSAPHITLLVLDQDTPASWISTGRSFERIALTATALEIQHAPFSQAIEYQPTREKLRREFALGLLTPQLFVRFGYAEPIGRSPRRPVEETLVREGTVSMKHLTMS